MDKKQEELNVEKKSKEAEEVKVETKEAEKEKKLDDIVTKLENLEKIENPAKKADEKCKIMPTEYGYKYNGPEPTRYGDWDVKGKCVDFWFRIIIFS